MKPWKTAVAVFVIDAVFVLAFVLIGRGSHGEAASISGVLTTFWPFFVGLLVGWLVTWAWSRPLALMWPGVPVWLMTVALGMLIRTATGQGIELAFITVAFVVLGIFLVGWRIVAIPFVRYRALRRI